MNARGDADKMNLNRIFARKDKEKNEYMNAKKPCNVFKVLLRERDSPNMRIIDIDI